MKVASVGDNCIDIYSDCHEGRHVPGGNAVNVAVSLANQDVFSAYIGWVGHDPEGRELLDALVSRKVDISLAEVKPGKTACTEIQIKDGERYFSGEDGGVQSPLILEPRVLQKLTKFSWVHFSAFSNWRGGYAHYQPHLADEIRFLKRHDVRISLDFSEPENWDNFPAEIENNLDVSFFSLPSSTSQGPAEIGRRLQRQWGGVVVVTMGEQGSLVVSSHGDIWKADAVKVKVVDTCGAGDAFIGTFLASILMDRSLGDAAHDASKVAACVCCQTGAWPNVNLP